MQGVGRGGADATATCIPGATPGHLVRAALLRFYRAPSSVELAMPGDSSAALLFRNRHAARHAPMSMTNSHPYCATADTCPQHNRLYSCMRTCHYPSAVPRLVTATLNVDFWSFGLVCKATTGDSPPGEVCALHALCGVRDVTRVGGLQFYRAQKRYFRYIYERTADRRDRRVSAHALGPNEHCHT